MRGSRLSVSLLILLIFALALRIGYVVAKGDLGRSPERGYREYVIAAGRLLEHGALLSPLIVEDLRLEPSSLFPPGYAAVTAGAYALLGVESFSATLVLQVVNALATTITVALVFLVASANFGVRAAWISALIATVNPLLFGFTELIWDTSLFTLGTALSVWVASALSSRRFAWGEYFWFGLWLGVLALLNPALTITYPLLVVWPLARTFGWRMGSLLRGITAALIGWMIAVAPWTVRNFVHFDRLMYVRGGFMHELWLGVCPEADGDRGDVFRNQFPLENELLQDHVASIGERAYIEERARLAREAIASDPWRFLRLAGVRAVDYWAGTILSHTGPVSRAWPGTAGRLGVTLFLLAELLLVVCGSLCWPRIERQIGWMLMIVLSFSVVYCITHVELRYRAPTEPLVAIILGAIAARASSSISQQREYRSCPNATSGKTGAET